jgi:hypothetical protein
MVSIVPYPLKK